MLATALHPTLTSSQLSQFSTLGEATGVSGPRARGRENVVASRGDSRIQVPLAFVPGSPNTEIRITWPKGLTIDFRTPSGQGVPFRDIRRGTAHFSRDSRPAFNFPEVVNDSLELRIIWPGYEHLPEERRIYIKKRSRIVTRQELALAIADKFEAFCREVEGAQFCHPNSKYEIKSVVVFNDLALCTLTNCGGNDAVFQASVEIIPN